MYLIFETSEAVPEELRALAFDYAVRAAGCSDEKTDLAAAYSASTDVVPFGLWETTHDRDVILVATVGCVVEREHDEPDAVYQKKLEDAIFGSRSVDVRLHIRYAFGLPETVAYRISRFTFDYTPKGYKEVSWYFSALPLYGGKETHRQQAVQAIGKIKALVEELT